MVLAVTGVLGLFKDAGLSMATIQRTAISDEEISTLFWFNVLVGVLLAVLSLVIAPFLVAFYHEPRLFWVSAVLGTGFFFSAATTQHQALLQRQMRFIALAWIDILSQLVSIAVGIVMAVAGFGYWALVGMSVALPVTYGLGLWFAAAWTPGRPRWRHGTYSLLHFGGTVTLNNVIIYLAYNTEKALLGRFWGAEVLGIYGRAYQLVNMPTGQLNTAIGWVAFPALSRIQDDPLRLKNYFLKGYSLVLGLTIPITIACALLADEIIFVFLGSNWMDAASIFRLLSPTVLAFALIHPFGWLLMAKGQVGRSLKMALVITPLVILAYVAGLPYGPNGVAFGFSAMMTVLIVPMIAWAIHGSPISSRDVITAISRPLLSGLVAAFISGGVYFLCSQYLSVFPRLLLDCSVLLGSYLWMLLYALGQKSFYLDLFRELIKRSSAGEQEPDAG
jgi:O-antigen/teichoic acid export membrane protein